MRWTAGSSSQSLADGYGWPTMRGEAGNSGWRLHEYVAQNASVIIDEWSKRMRRALAPEAMSTSQLRDSLPLFLQHIARALASEVDGEAPPHNPAHLALAPTTPSAV